MREYLDYNKIDPLLAVGADPGNPHRLVGYFDVVVDCQVDRNSRAEEMTQLGIEYRRLPFVDGGKLPTPQEMSETVSWLIEQRRLGKRCLIHCTAGLSRSPLIAAALLVKEQGLPLDQALDMVRKYRVRVQLNPAMVEDLKSNLARVRIAK